MAKRAGLELEDRARVQLLRLDTIMAFGVAIHCNGTGADDQEIRWLTKKVSGAILDNATDDATNDLKRPFVRRLWMECYGCANETQRAQILGSQTGIPVQLSNAERCSRMEEIQTRLPELGWEDHTIRVGPACLDKVVDMMEKDKIRFIPWAFYTTEEQEAAGIKQDPCWEVQPSGKMHIVQPPDYCHATVSDDATISAALQRRSLAFDLARICEYGLMQRWTIKLMTAYRSRPMPGRARVSLEQLHQADQ